MSKRYGTLYERIERETVPEPNSGCWLFFGCWDDKGYGRIRIEKTKARVHCLSYKRHNGEIPAGMIVRHKCDNPCCINPDHLVLGTPLDNIADRQERNRQAKGERLPQHKLSEEDVLAILKDTRTHRAIASQYGVAHSVIGRIQRGEKWRYLSAA